MGFCQTNCWTYFFFGGGGGHRVRGWWLAYHEGNAEGRVETERRHEVGGWRSERHWKHQFRTHITRQRGIHRVIQQRTVHSRYFGDSPQGLPV